MHFLIRIGCRIVFSEVEVFSSKPRPCCHNLSLTNAHITQLHLVITISQNTGVIQKSKLSSFLTNTLDHLGHVIQPKRLRIESHTTEAIKILKLPTNVTNFCTILGLNNVFGRLFTFSRAFRFHENKSCGKSSQIILAC